MNSLKALEICNNEYSENRRIHTLGVLKVVKKLAIYYDLDSELLEIAALFHDYAKAKMSIDEQIQYIKDNMDDDLLDNPKELFHGFVSADILLNKYKYENRIVYDAIFDHVSGNQEMSDIAKVLFIADTCEPNRKHDYVDSIYQTSLSSIDEGLKLGCSVKNEYTISKGGKLHINTIKLLKELGVENYE